jgi:hypothetical protein
MSSAMFFMLRPMFLLTFSIAVTDEHTRLARVETGAPLLPALSAAADIDLVHPFFDYGAAKGAHGSEFEQEQKPDIVSMNDFSPNTRTKRKLAEFPPSEQLY